MRSGIGSADDGRRCRRPTGRSPARWVKGLERGRYMIGSTTWGVGALIQRGGRAVAGMLTIATAGGS